MLTEDTVAVAGNPVSAALRGTNCRAMVTSVTPVSGTVVTTYTFDAANRLTNREVSDGRTYTRWAKPIPGRTGGK